MLDQPIACSLTEADRTAVLAKYAQASRLYQGSVRLNGSRAQVFLRGDKELLAVLLDEMIVQEGACCSFLQFDLKGAVDGYHVQLNVRGAPRLEPTVLREVVHALFPAAIGEDSQSP